MPEENITEKSLNNSFRKGRSSAYPAHNISEVIEAVEKLYKNLGKGPFNRDSVAIALGYKGLSGASAIKISACIQFGLLNKSGNTYFVADLAKRILTPTSEEEKENAILESLRTPSLYGALISEYEGQALPTMLPNILSRNYGILESSAKKAAEVFQESLEFGGILKDGVLQKPNKQKIESNEEEAVRGTTNSKQNPSEVPNTPKSKTFEEIEIPIPGVNAKIVLGKEYMFSLSMGQLAEGIAGLKSSLESAKVDENTNEQK